MNYTNYTNYVNSSVISKSFFRVQAIVDKTQKFDLPISNINIFITHFLKNLFSYIYYEYIC